MYRNEYLEEQREISRKNRSRNWFRLESIKYESVPDYEDKSYKDEIFSDVDPNTYFYS